MEKLKNVKQMHDFKVKSGSSSSWDFSNYEWGEGDLVAAGFSWPPRCYICSFCKREFRSAQALGGHMNVHRRDRARLRQSPTRDIIGNNNINASQFALINLNLEPNPNPSFFPSSPPPPPPLSSLLTKFPQFTSKLPPPAVQVQPITADLMKPRAAKELFVEKFRSSKRCEDFKQPEFVRLDLEIGLITQSKEELDLELRLGYI